MAQPTAGRVIALQGLTFAAGMGNVHFARRFAWRTLAA